MSLLVDKLMLILQAYMLAPAVSYLSNTCHCRTGDKGRELDSMMHWVATYLDLSWLPCGFR